jgi:hypothetical protein
MGRAARPALEKARTAKPSLEMLRRLEPLLDSLKRSEKFPEHLGIHRAVEVLETIGTDAARQGLAEVAKNCPDEEARADAAASLERLRRLPPRPVGGVRP